MDYLEELNSRLSGGSRVIVIAEADVDLRPSSGENRLLLLQIAEGSLASGGRGGGFGERRVVGAALYARRDGEWTKPFETADESEAGSFEVPYYVTRIPMTLKDGSEAMGYGVVDQSLVSEMVKKSDRASA